LQKITSGIDFPQLKLLLQFDASRARQTVIIKLENKQTNLIMQTSLIAPQAERIYREKASQVEKLY